MNPQNLLIKWGITMLLFITCAGAMAQGPYPNTGNHSVCLNVTEPYGVVLTAGSTYSWSITPITGGNGTITPGATSNLISVNWNNVGTATLQVIETNAQGCVGDPVTIIVTVNPIPIVVINNPAPACSPGTVDLTAVSVTIGSTPGLTFSYWTDAAATVPFASPTVAPAGTYYIKGTSVAGCFDIKPVVVTVTPAPILVINNPIPVCAPGTVDLTSPSITTGSTPGLTFTYWTDAAATIPYATPATAPAGTYYIKGTSVAGCFDIKPVVVNITPSPTLVITNPAPACSPGTVDLTASSITTGSTPGMIFSYWTDAATTIPYPTPTTATAGTYYIKGTLPAGCFDIKPVVVTVVPGPILQVTNPAPVCGPGTVDLTAGSITTGSTPGLVFTYWTDAAATVPYTTPTAATAGTYYIKGTLGGSCFDIKPVIVTANPLPGSVISGPNPVCESVNGSTVTYNTPNTPGHTYSWVVTGGTISTGQNTNQITVTWTTPGSGSVSITESITLTGCAAMVVKTVIISPKPITSPITHN